MGGSQILWQKVINETSCYRKILFIFFRDVDFNLDGSFEKLSSFKIDMPDLDFSCPPKKTEKGRSTGKEGGSPNGSLQKDMDSLNFSFDFTE